MKNDSVKNLCLFHIIDGLRQGLSHFSGPSRAALMYAEMADDPIRVYDPQDLLRGHARTQIYRGFQRGVWVFETGWKAGL